jgi:hypothetical protein
MTKKRFFNACIAESGSEPNVKLKAAASVWSTASICRSMPSARSAGGDGGAIPSSS